MKKIVNARAVKKAVSLLLMCALMMSLFVCAASVSAVAADYSVSTDAELINALYDISLKSEGSYVIDLQQDITHSGGYKMNKNTITIIGNGHTISFTGSQQGFKVYSGAVLNLGYGNNDSLILQGDGETHNEKGDPAIPDNDNPGLIHINGADSVCNMNSGVVVQNHRGNNYLGGGVTVESGTFNMNGGTIDRCGIDGGSVCYGGGVAVYGKGKFVMNGGTISNCYALSDAEQIQNDSNYNDKYKTAMGGGVLVTGESTFIMNGGTITNNRATRRGGGVAIVASQYQSNYNKNKAVINGGTISNNTSKVGGGIFVSGYEMPYCSGITFSAVVADTITVENSTNVTGNSKSLNNKPEKALSGSDIIPDQGFNMYGGTISGNTADIAGGGLSLFSVAETSTIKNATINSNTVNYDSEITNDYNDYVDGYPHYANNGKGGGILISKYGSGTATVEGCTINENSSAKNGGGIAVISADKSTHIKDTTINSNTSGDRGAGLYYSAENNKSLVYLSGANTVQDNVYNNHLNNVNVISTTKPINVEGSLEGSKIGLSDPTLWDDGITDAAAPDDGSAELLTKGYKQYNPTVHPSEYFTSDHESWYVDFGEKKTEQGPEIGRTYTYTAKTYNAVSRSTGSTSGRDTIFDVEAVTFSTGKADTREKLYDELTARYTAEYTKTSKDNYTDPVSGSVISVHLYTANMVHIVVDGKYIMAKVNDQSLVDSGHLALRSVNTYLDEAVYSDTPTEKTITLNSPISSDSIKYSYNDIGHTISKTEILKSTETEEIQYETTTTDYTSEVRLVRKTTPVKFHTNNPTVTDATKRNNELFRIYNAEEGNTDNPEDGKHSLNSKYQISEFYNIPAFAEDGYVFAGWYYHTEGDKDGDIPFEFDAEIPANLTDVYAHWIEVGSVDKSDEDEKVLPNDGNSYRGFGLAGVQIRPEAQFDYNMGEYYYGGLRFISSVSENLLSKVDALSDKTVGENNNRVEYGYVTARKDTVDAFLSVTQVSADGYKLQYKGENVNGVNTTLKEPYATNYRYVTNVDCTANDYSGKSGIIDHKLFKEGDKKLYRLMTFVVTYKGNEADKDVNIVARAYIRYYDANGLLRTFYNDYGGTNTYGGCCTNYTDVNPNRTTVTQ